MAELFKQIPGTGIPVRLKHDDHFPPWPTIGHGSADGGYFTGVVGIIVDKQHGFPVNMDITQDRTPAVYTLEVCQSGTDCLFRYAQFGCQRHCRQRIKDVMPARQVQRHRESIIPVALHYVETGGCTVIFD